MESLASPLPALPSLAAAAAATGAGGCDGRVGHGEVFAEGEGSACTGARAVLVQHALERHLRQRVARRAAPV